MTLFDDAWRTLQRYRSDDVDQRRLRAEYLAHLTAHPDATRRDGHPVHLTVGVLVIDPSATKVLLTHHRKADAWYQFGGHIELTDTSLRSAAARELVEESGLGDVTVPDDPVHLDRHALPAVFGRCREHLDVRYAAVTQAAFVPVVSAESHDVRWFAIDDLPPATAADLAGLIAAARAALGVGPAAR